MTLGVFNGVWLVLRMVIGIFRRFSRVYRASRSRRVCGYQEGPEWYLAASEGILRSKGYQIDP